VEIYIIFLNEITETWNGCESILDNESQTLTTKLKYIFKFIIIEIDSIHRKIIIVYSLSKICYQLIYKGGNIVNNYKL